MFKNYFKIAWRNLVKNKGYSAIHIIGLTVGFWACAVVATVVMDALSYDRQWSRSDRIYRINTIATMGDGITDKFSRSFGGLGAALKKDFPEVAGYAAIDCGETQFGLKEEVGDIFKTRIMRADTSVWNILDFTILEGKPDAFVHGSQNLVITKSFRNRVFPGVNPVGQMVYEFSRYKSKPVAYLVTGVIDDLPANSSFFAEAVQVQSPGREELSPRESGSFKANYLLLTPGTNGKAFEAKLNTWYRQFTEQKSKYQYELQPVTDLYLHSDFERNEDFRGNARNIYFFAGIAALLLAIACINFVNLSTARGISRLKETGVRKVLSASRRDLVFQFMTEGLLVFGIAFMIAMRLYHVSLPGVELFLSHKLTRVITADFLLFSGTLAIIAVTWLLTTLYPAWILSGFRPVEVLKGKLFSKAFAGVDHVRRGLVVIQFGISIVVLVGLIVAQSQIRFMRQTDLGYNKANLLAIDYLSWDGQSDAFKSEVTRIAGVKSASFTQWVPSRGGGFMSREVEDPREPGKKHKVWYLSGDADLARTLELSLQEGRFLDARFPADVLNADSLQAVDWVKYEEAIGEQPTLVTESAVKLLGITQLGWKHAAANTVPVGIVGNFNNESLYEPVKPAVIMATRSPRYGGMLIRTAPGQEERVVAEVQKLFKKIYPLKVPDLTRVSDLLDQQYEADEQFSKLLLVFSGLTMVLALMGILGLAVQAAGTRTKEIGIRKVLGSSVGSIVTLLNRDFVMLVLIALAVASPVAWLLMSKWLQNFAYRVPIEWWMFMAAGLLTTGITLLTVSWQAVKAAVANPVESLRNE